MFSPSVGLTLYNIEYTFLLKYIPSAVEPNKVAEETYFPKRGQLQNVSQIRCHWVLLKAAETQKYAKCTSPDLDRCAISWARPAPNPPSSLLTSEVTFQVAVLAFRLLSNSATILALSASNLGLQPGTGLANPHDPAVSGVSVYDIAFVSTENTSTLTFSSRRSSRDVDTQRGVLNGGGRLHARGERYLTSL